jgi:DNA polymerase-3 subunit delta'
VIEILNHSKSFDQIYPWFEIIQKKFDLESMPQALLLHGQAGIGKFDFAIHLAQSLLCEADLFSAGTKPCKQCEACRWFETGNHPDLIALVPQTYRKKLPHAALEGLEKSSEMLGDEEPESPKLEAESADIATEPKEKKQSGFIRMEQSLAAIQSMGIGSHRGGYRVLLIYPLELLRVEAANALLNAGLKTLCTAVSPASVVICPPAFHPLVAACPSFVFFKLWPNSITLFGSCIR